jgi:hypothetical protein
LTDSLLDQTNPFAIITAAQKFTQDLIAYEEEKKMPYITSAERIGIEKGRLEGRSEGIDLGRDEGMVFTAREMLLEALDEKFSTAPPQTSRSRSKP